MKTIRESSREEAVSYYLCSEMARLIEQADASATLESAAISALRSACNPGQGALQSLCCALLANFRGHSWLYDRFWEEGRRWSLIQVTPAEIDMMPLGGDGNAFHYPKLDALVQQLRLAACQNQKVQGINDEPAFLLRQRAKPPLHERILLIKGKYANRSFDYAIGDGAHRAIFLAANGARHLEAYYGQPVM